MGEGAQEKGVGMSIALEISITGNHDLEPGASAARRPSPRRPIVTGVSKALVLLTMSSSHHQYIRVLSGINTPSTLPARLRASPHLLPLLDCLRTASTTIRLGDNC